MERDGTAGNLWHDEHRIGGERSDQEQLSTMHVLSDATNIAQQPVSLLMKVRAKGKNIIPKGLAKWRLLKTKEGF